MPPLCRRRWVLTPFFSLPFGQGGRRVILVGRSVGRLFGRSSPLSGETTYQVPYNIPTCGRSRGNQGALAQTLGDPLGNNDLRHPAACKYSINSRGRKISLCPGLPTGRADTFTSQKKRSSYSGGYPSARWDLIVEGNRDSRQSRSTTGTAAPPACHRIVVARVA